MAMPFNSLPATILRSYIKSSKVELSFDGDHLSSDGGVLLLRDLESEIGIVKLMSDQITDPRHQSYVDHSLYDQCLQRILCIACGYEDGNDSDPDRLRQDPAFKTALGRRPDDDLDLASQPTISRFENIPTQTELYRIGTAFVDHFIASYQHVPNSIILDFDDTENKVYGGQQLALFNAYYNDKCYLPLHIYEAISGKLVTAILKPGKRLTGVQMVAIIKRLIKRLRQVWPDTNIFIRGDSHFAYPELMAWVEAQNQQNTPDEPISDADDLTGRLFYITGLSANSVLKQRAQAMIDQAVDLYSINKEPVTLYTEFKYQAGSWSQARRVYAKVKVDKDGYRVFFRVTNITHMRPSVMEGNVYNPRANCELRIKAHKCDLRSDRTSCNRFEANQFRLFLHSAAYVLLHAMTSRLLKATAWASATFKTIRQLVLKIAVRIVTMKTKVKIIFPKNHPNLKTIQRCFVIMSHLRQHPLE